MNEQMSELMNEQRVLTKYVKVRQAEHLVSNVHFPLLCPLQSRKGVTPIVKKLKPNMGR